MKVTLEPVRRLVLRKNKNNGTTDRASGSPNTMRIFKCNEKVLRVASVHRETGTEALAQRRQFLEHGGSGGCVLVGSLSCLF